MTARRIHRHTPQGTVPQAPEVAAITRFHRSMPGYAPTPLTGAPEIADRLGVGRVWVKDESHRLGMPAFKILGASWATYRALCDHVGLDHRQPDGLAALREHLAGRTALTLVAATDGNHGRAVARMATMLSLRAHILVPQDMVPARIAALEQEGAEVTVVPGTYDQAVAASARLHDDTHLVVSDTSWDGYRQIPAWVIDGYSTIAHEVHQQLGALGEPTPNVVALQVGVGAFAASMIRAFANADTKIVAVEPANAACALASAEAGELKSVGGNLDSIMAGLNCGTPSRIAWPTLAAGVGYFTCVDDADAEDAMRALAAAGITSGESGAAGLAGLLAFRAELDLHPTDRVLVISTEGATDPAGYQRIVGSSTPACATTM